MNRIIFENLVIGYKNPITSPINLTIEDGDYVVVIGENGAGKTTLLKTMLNLNEKLSGDIIFENINRDEIGYLPQSTSIANDFPATVYEVVLSGNNISPFPFYSKAEKKRAEKIMEELNITELKHDSLSEISGGQKQRVLLARALVNPKKLLLIDEPTNNLDEKSIDELFKILEKINSMGTTILLITHEKNYAYQFAKSILKIEEGNVTLEKVRRDV